MEEREVVGALRAFVEAAISADVTVERQSTTVPKTSKRRAFGGEVSDIFQLGSVRRSETVDITLHVTTTMVNMWYQTLVSNSRISSLRVGGFDYPAPPSHWDTQEDLGLPPIDKILFMVRSRVRPSVSFEGVQS